MSVVIIGNSLKHGNYEQSARVSFKQWRRAVERNLYHWLEDLQLCGLDLVEYGMAEDKAFNEDGDVRSL